tara:strand:- start:1353 stop:1574 length:222 start_codon:yes stop_codon:yes gene_type:complete
MKYIDEVCSVLTDEVERRYLRTLDAWQILTDEMANTEQPSRELIQQVEHAHKEYISASKEYLAIAFKKRFLDQ